MARIIGTERTIDVLINCKTYPAVSKKYIETVCTGGVSRGGKFVRLYPIPFRLLSEKEQYDRWDVVRVKVYNDTKDTRRESAHLEPAATIQIIDKIRKDQVKWDWMKSCVFDSADAMESKGLTNGLVEIVPEELYWESEKKTWSPAQLETLNQGNLFHKQSVMESLADRVPWQFKLRFTEKNSGRKFDQKVLAWSYYQGYRNCLVDLGNEQAALAALREKVHKSILDPKRSVFAILGTHSRFGQWMISGLYHLPKTIRENSSLF
ncbi:MAG: hypothetical protein ABSH08_05110 [Tepidisphaeraceae bacterium]|jgi:hypothetical protein